MQDSCITVQEKVEEIIYPQPQSQVQEKVVVPTIVQEPNEVEEVIDPAWREYVYNVEGKPTRTMSLVQSTGAQELTEEDIKIATDKNWVVNR